VLVCSLIRFKLSIFPSTCYNMLFKAVELIGKGVHNWSDCIYVLQGLSYHQSLRPYACTLINKTIKHWYKLSCFQATHNTGINNHLVLFRLSTLNSKMALVTTCITSSLSWKKCAFVGLFMGQAELLKCYLHQNSQHPFFVPLPKKGPRSKF